MSLSDSIFIFVLALIIFGPKKLPGMAKQLGKLVGEFRRASNEFKFQIEDELRQVEIQDRQKPRQPASTPEPTILPPSLQVEASAGETEEDLEALTLASPLYSPLIPTLPSAQSPALSPTEPTYTAPVIAPAAGAEPRNSQPVTEPAKESSEVVPTHD